MRINSFSAVLLAVIVSLGYPALANAGDNIKTGGEIFKKYCIVCHGEKGIGDGVNADNMDPAPRDMTDSGKEKYMVKRTNEDLFKAIKLGGREIEKSGLMPPFGNTLSEKEIWSVVAFIKTLYKGSAPAIDFSKKMSDKVSSVKIKSVSIEPPDRKAKIRGKRTYGKYGCSGCHKIKGRGGSSGGSLMGVGSKLKPEQIYKITQNAKAVKADSVMPVYGLPEETAVGITRFLMSLE